MARSYSPLTLNPMARLASALKSAGFDWRIAVHESIWPDWQSFLTSAALQADALIGRREHSRQPVRTRCDIAGEDCVRAGVGIAVVNIGEQHLALIHHLPAPPVVGSRAVLLETGQFDGAIYDRPLPGQRCLPLQGECKQRDDGAERAEGDHQRR